MGFLSWALFGLIAGAIARMLVPGSGAGGLIVTVVLGVVGAVVGGFLATMLGFGEIDGFDVRSFLIAIGGSVVLLAGFRMLSRG
ncbi:MAG: GlsB/YeaQ/YmgE family stress response membrane protein [Rubripirellula sp.]|nr:GlsB/YeaQ/YmgE family stress response membrane protein [Rubripirellula sp.]